METREKLNQLVELRATVDNLNIKKQELIDLILTPEIKQKVNDIEDEFAPEFQALNEKLTGIEETIKWEVVELGVTVQGDLLEAVFCGGRISWDTKGLDEAIKVLPQLAQYKKQGDPYVTIRARKGVK
jgi:hypothetical protein